MTTSRLVKQVATVLIEQLGTKRAAVLMMEMRDTNKVKAPKAAALFFQQVSFELYATFKKP